MTEETAHRPSLWRTAGRAWIKGLAQTTVGSKVLRAVYESHFEAAGGHQRMFRGLFPDFASAAATEPPGKQVGRNGDATVARHAHERHFIFPSDYAVLFWLSRLISDARLLFDLGGDVGSRYLAFREYLSYPDNFTWLANEIPAVVALGRTIAEEEAPPHLQFTTDDARRGEADILLASSVLQVLEDWNGLLKRAASLPRHILINRTPVGDRPSFIAGFVELGYWLVDEWLTWELGCQIPDHASHSLMHSADFISLSIGRRRCEWADTPSNRTCWFDS
jgi:putative methyltransferase (TIGR04325 family)